MIILYILLTAVFFSGLFFYLINYSLLPYDDDFNLDIQNLLIVSLLFIVCIALIFVFFHLILDKLFFRRFYEKPKIFLAIRRGTLVGFVLAGIAWLRIFEFWQWHIILLIVLLGVLFELLFLNIGRGKRPKDSAESKSDSISD